MHLHYKYNDFIYMKEIRSRTSKPVRASERRDSESLRSRKWQHCRRYCYALRNNNNMTLFDTFVVIVMHYAITIIYFWLLHQCLF